MSDEPRPRHASQPSAVPLHYAATRDPWPRWLAWTALTSAGAFLLAVPLLCVGNFASDAAVIAFVSLPFAALALGIAARARAARDDEQTRRRAKEAIVLGCGQIAIVLGLGLLLSEMGRPRESANRVKCASSLRQIGQALLLYANDHAGAYPPTPGPLIATTGIASQCFTCPSSGETPAATPQALDAAPKRHLSYIYLAANGRLGSPPTRIEAYEPLSNHDGAGMNVLFADGRVEWLDAAEATRMTAELQAGHNPPRAAIAPTTRPASGHAQ